MALEYFCCFNSYRKKTRNLSDSELGRLFRALMPSGYYDVQRKKQALESKKRSITNKIVTASRNVTVEKTNGKPFVNSFGEATKREITATSYKNSQARLDKEIMRFVGGEINRKKQTKRRK